MKFDGKVRALMDLLVVSTIAVYNDISNCLRPTPQKLHYTYNLRDVSKVFQGMAQADKNFCKSKNDIIRLWGHECTRIFHDRLINEDDRNWFKDCLARTCESSLKTKWTQVRGDNDPLLYGNFVEQEDDKIYKEIDDHDKLKDAMKDFLKDYNSMHKKKMELVLFMNAIEHCARISRVLALPKGNVLLVGVGGSGRRSLTRLAASMNEFSIIEIEITKTYGLNEWKEDLVRVFKSAGMDGKPTCFLLSDTQIKT